MRPRMAFGSSRSCHQRVPFSRTSLEKFSAMERTPWLMPSETMKMMPLISGFWGDWARAFWGRRAAMLPRLPIFNQSRLARGVSLMGVNLRVVGFLASVGISELGWSNGDAGLARGAGRL